jgi:ABC-2 type transport system permease protein
MMLWYKAWIETRARFLVSLGGITCVLAFIVHHLEYVMSPSRVYDYLILYRANLLLTVMWTLSVILLGLGGLVRERAVGASSFTLALPVSRARLVGVRIAIGILQAIFLAVLPWVAMLLISGHSGRTFFVSQAALYLLLLISGGLNYLAMAVLISSLTEGEYTAPAIAYGLTFLTGILFANIDRLKPYVNIWKFMTGGTLFDNRTYLLSGPIPWPGILASLCVAALMFAASVRIIQKREF